MISNDTDLAHPIQIVRTRFIPVRILYPCSGSRAPSLDLRKAAAQSGRAHVIGAAKLAAAQFANPLSDGNGTFYKPASW